MQVNISGHHVEVTDPLKDYVKSRLEKLGRHHDQISSVQVTLSVEKTRQKAEAQISIPGNKIHADATHDDLYAAIDLLNDKLDRQLLKHKEKTVNRKQGH